MDLGRPSDRLKKMGKVLILLIETVGRVQIKVTNQFHFIWLFSRELRI